MMIVDKSTPKYDLLIYVDYGFGLYIQYRRGYMQHLNIKIMGITIAFTWGPLGDLGD